MVPWAHPSLHPKRHVDRFNRFCMGPKCYAVQCIVSGEETPKAAPLRWDFVTPPEEDRSTAIGNMHRKIGKDRACGSVDIFADRRQTRTHTEMLVTILRRYTPAGEV